MKDIKDLVNEFEQDIKNILSDIQKEIGGEPIKQNSAKGN